MGRVWGGFGEDLGRVWVGFCEGFGRVWGGLGSVRRGSLTQPDTGRRPSKNPQTENVSVWRLPALDRQEHLSVWRSPALDCKFCLEILRQKVFLSGVRLPWIASSVYKFLKYLLDFLDAVLPLILRQKESHYQSSSGP